jgi:hypothetical protein
MKIPRIKVPEHHEPNLAELIIGIYIGNRPVKVMIITDLTSYGEK